MLLAVELQWWQILMSLLGAGGLGAIILFFLKWIRYKKADAGDVSIKSAQVEKLLAESEETRARGDVSVADAALRWAERLTIECNKTRDQLDKAEKDLEVALDSLRDATIKMSEAQHELKNERQKNIFMAAEIETLHLEIKKLNIK